MPRRSLTAKQRERPNALHLQIRSDVIDAGLDLEANSDAVIRVALERFAATVLRNIQVECGKCCDNCRCVALANTLSELRSK